MGRKAKGRTPPVAAPEAQEVRDPEIPILDELGFETVEFKCWKCARPDYREKNFAEALTRNGHRLYCLPCERPDIFEWETTVVDVADGTTRDFIRPLSAKETYKKLTPEARALCEKQAVAQIMRARRDAILELTRSLEIEYMSLLPAIELAEADVLTAQAKVSAMEHNEIGKKVRTVEQLNADIKRLVAEIATAEKAAQEAQEAQP